MSAWNISVTKGIHLTLQSKCESCMISLHFGAKSFLFTWTSEQTYCILELNAFSISAQSKSLGFSFRDGLLRRTVLDSHKDLTTGYTLINNIFAIISFDCHHRFLKLSMTKLFVLLMLHNKLYKINTPFTTNLQDVTVTSAPACCIVSQYVNAYYSWFLQGRV